LQPVLSAENIVALQQRVRKVRVDESLNNYILDLVTATRKHPDVYLGASTRAALSLDRAAQALALLQHRDYVIPDDIKRLAGPVLTHRLLAKGYRQGALGDGAGRIMRDILDRTSIPS
jgi:MoxR-like ATPase